MKRIWLVAVLFLTACGNVNATTIKGEVVSCDSIKINSSIARGVKLPCLNGNSGVSIEQLRGPVIVNVWGSWCPPCRDEIPYFVKLDSKKIIPIVGIAVDEAKVRDPQDFVKNNGMRYPILFDDKSATAKTIGPGVPVSLYIDENGRITKRKIGKFTDYEELKSFAKA